MIWYKATLKKTYHALLDWTRRRIKSNTAEILEKIQKEQYSSVNE